MSATMGSHVQSFAIATCPPIGSLGHARLVLSIMEHRMAATLEHYYRIDKRYAWAIGAQDSLPDPAEREKEKVLVRELAHEVREYKQSWGPQAREGVRFWEQEVKRMEHAARTAEAGKGAQQ